jgi:hypothetical protein
LIETARKNAAAKGSTSGSRPGMPKRSPARTRASTSSPQRSAPSSPPTTGPWPGSWAGSVGPAGASGLPAGHRPAAWRPCSRSCGRSCATRPGSRECLRLGPPGLCAGVARRPLRAGDRGARHGAVRDSGEQVWQLFSTAYGPTKTLADSLDAERREQLHRNWVELYEGHRVGDQIQQSRTYLLVTGLRR